MTLGAISFLILSVAFSVGASILLVEKRFEFPVRRINLTIRCWLRIISKRLAFSRKLVRLPLCAICVAFWMPLFVEIPLALVYGMWMWPMSGFAASGVCWFIYEFLSAVEARNS